MLETRNLSEESRRRAAHAIRSKPKGLCTSHPASQPAYQPASLSAISACSFRQYTSNDVATPICLLLFPSPRIPLGTFRYGTIRGAPCLAASKARSHMRRPKTYRLHASCSRGNLAPPRGPAAPSLSARSALRARRPTRLPHALPATAVATRDMGEGTWPQSGVINATQRSLPS